MTTENSRADALTDEQRIGLEKAMAWCPHGSSEANTIRELLAASPVEPPAAAPIDEPSVNDTITFSSDSLTLSGAQLLEALDFIAPDRDADQLESEVTIQYGEGHTGKGMYCWCTEYPEEGAIFIDGSTAVPAAPAPSPADERAALSEDRIDWIANAHCPNGTAYPVNVKNAIREALREARINFDETGAEGVAIPTEEMRLAMTQETPYFWRRSMDKSCYEVGIQTNDDWREVISDDQTILATFDDGDAAADHFDRLEFVWRYVRMLEAAPQPAQPAAREVLTDEQREALQHAINAAEEDCAYTTATTLRTIIATHPRQPGQPERTDTHGWLRSGSLLYRLTDERHPQNRDEINVTMAGGSRADAGRIARAVQLLEFLSRQPEPRAEVTNPFRELLAALIDIYDDERNNAPEDRCYVEGAWSEVLGEARALLAPLPDPAQVAAESPDWIKNALPPEGA